MQQPGKKISNYNKVSAMLKFSIAGKGLKMAGWINEAFSRTSGWCFRIPAVFSESEWCPQQSVAEEEQRNLKANYFHVSCGGGHQLISVHSEVSYNHGISQLLGKAASFILGNITINQKLLIWQDVVDKEGSLYPRGLKPLWQKVTQFFLRRREIQSYRC